MPQNLFQSKEVLIAKYPDVLIAVHSDVYRGVLFVPIKSEILIETLIKKDPRFEYSFNIDIRTEGVFIDVIIKEEIKKVKVKEK